MKGIDPNIWTITQISYLEPDKERYTVTIEKSDDDYERDYYPNY